MDYSKWNTIYLPQVWELSGDTSLFNKDGVIWFQKEIIIRDKPDIENATLYLGAIDDSDKTWVNGVLIGEMYNRYNKNRSYSIDKNILIKGKNTIVVRVEDYTGEGGFTSNPTDFSLSVGSNKINLSGNWKYKIGMFPKEPLPKNIFGPNIYPSLLYNGMIHPIINFPIKGVIWYQGESNTYNAIEYLDLFKRWIKDWRNVWNNQSMPFLWVQLANFGNAQEVPKNSNWAELREAQELALDLTNTAMITAIDIGEGKNIHPKNKQEVSKRLSNAALNLIYDYKKIKYKGPKYIKYEKNNKFITITFDNLDSALKVTDKYGYVKGFTIAGEDKIFHWANAHIIGDNQVNVWSDKVANPVAVRYSWSDNPEDSNLLDENNYPVFPFRTDSW
jgi:sialate O-acetylesterase